MLNNRFAREALKQAATQVSPRCSRRRAAIYRARGHPLRDRVDELEGRVARLERQLAERCGNAIEPGVELCGLGRFGVSMMRGSGHA